MKLVKLGLILLIITLVTGCFRSSADYDEETIAKAEVTVERYLKERYIGIETVEIEEVYKGPMGGMRVSGTVNNKFGFGIGVEETDFTIGSMSEKQGFPERKR